MAPTKPRSKPTIHRARALARIADPTLPRKVHRPGAVVADGFSSTKRDKRLIKHSAFVSKIEKVQGPSASARKRRRPSRKLVTTLESLAGALPELEGGAEAEALARQEREGKVRHKSLKSKPGALKKKEKVMKGEMARFGANLALLSATKEETVAASGSDEVMTGVVAQTPTSETASGTVKAAEAGPQTGQRTTSTANRWAALRGFISSTMEQNPAFLGRP